MSITMDDFEYFQSHVLKPDDTFKFTCKMCGKCCRNRETPILITGNDVFYIAKALDIAPANVIVKYTDCYIGHNSKIPVCTLLERPDGSCKLMRKSRCMVQSMKPAVCALYPLGRMIDTRKMRYEYFTQPYGCSNSLNEDEHTLQEWIKEFGLDKREEEAFGWQKLAISASEAMRKMKMQKTEKERENLNMLLLAALYLNYPQDCEYNESLKINQALLESKLPGFKMIESEVTE